MPQNTLTLQDFEDIRPRVKVAFANTPHSVEVVRTWLIITSLLSAHHEMLVEKIVVKK